MPTTANDALDAMQAFQDGEITGEELRKVGVLLEKSTLKTEDENKKVPKRGTKKVNALNDRAIKSAKPKERDYKLTDGEGLFLLVAKTGGKRWRFKYRFDGKEKIVSIGTYPAISLIDARTIKNKMRTKVANGISPADEKRKTKEEQETVQRKTLFTFEKLAGDLLEERLSNGSISKSTYNRNYLYLNKDAYPIIGNLPVGEITSNNIKTVIAKVVDRNAHESARKLFYALSKTFKTLVSRNNDDDPKHSYGIEFNPCKLIEISDLVGEQVEKNYPTITEPKKIKALLLAIDGYKGDIATKWALSLMPYTALRPGNIRLAEWKELDFKKKIWKIKKEKMKSKEDFTIPLTDSMIAIIKQMEPLSGDGRYVFPSPNDNSRALSDNTLNGALRRLGYTKEEFTAHGFRAMFSTITNDETEFKHEFIEACLAHSIGNEVSKAYNRAEYLKKRSEVMQWWSDYLDGLKA